MASKPSKGNWVSKGASTIFSAIKAGWFPYHSQSVPIRHIANATNPEQDVLTREWVKMKLDEFNVVSVTAALAAAVVTGTIAWPDPPKPWTVTAFWACSLVHALFAIILATQQSVVLTRASVGPNSSANLRALFGATKTTSKYRSSGVMLYIWQAPTMMLGTSLLFLLLGLMVLFYTAAANADAWGPEVKIAIWFSLSMAFGTVTYLLSWEQTEWQYQTLSDADQDVVDAER